MRPLFEAKHPLGATPVRLWVFPGQGAQSVGMGKKLYDESPTYRDIFDRGHKALLGAVDLDLKKITYEGPKEQLTRTLHAQPALLVSNVAFIEHLRVEEGISPTAEDLLAGHSLGEWTAYTVAKALTIEEGALAVYWRGRLMEEAFPYDPTAGSPMAAIRGLNEDQIHEVCQSVSRSCLMVVPANLNTPNQIVISGNPKAVQEAGELLKQRGATQVVSLPVAGPFHSPLMEPAKEMFASKLHELGIRFAPIQYTVVANYSAQPMASEADHLASLLNQITGSVRWNESMIKAYELGAVEMVNVDVEGNILSGLAREIFSEKIPVQPIDPKISMHRHFLRMRPGAIQTMKFAPESHAKARRILELSYDAGAVAQVVKQLMIKGDVSTALIVLDNRYNPSREAGMRELQSYSQLPEIEEAMRSRGFVTEEGELRWPEAVVRDLKIYPLSNDAKDNVQTEIFKELSAKKIGPVDVETLIYYVESRWGADEQKLEQILWALRRLMNLSPVKLKVTKYKDREGVEQKEIDNWDKVILYVDGHISFPHPGAMTQGECA